MYDSKTNEILNALELSCFWKTHKTEDSKMLFPLGKKRFSPVGKICSSKDEHDLE